MDSAPAPDLFDLAPEPEPPEEPEPHRRRRWPRVAGAATGGAAIGLVFHFGVTATALTALAAAAAAAATRPWQRRVLWTCFAAGVCAQITSIFVSPFTWPLRFAFFGVLIGAYVLQVAGLLRHL